ncbi:hypothetical protein PUN28_018177 [Cardiocondyla obscurior]|uniref:DUF4776 domain-containing protein n=1 Tax=Cardiocondyla obscurior TaxID=286306 RepID=A0AAW2EG51_9HYME
MALRKKMLLKKEQLYMLEILIDDLNLYSEKVINKHDSLMIRIKFVDLEPVNISPKSCKINKVTGDSKSGFSDKRINFEGKTCLLVRTPSGLIQSIKSTPLSIKVYSHCNEEQYNLRDNTLCEATAFLPEFCDRITTAKNKIDGLSKSHISTKIYTLTDKDGNLCGSISMCLRFSCFGSSIINHLALREKSFILGGFPLGWKLSCTKVSNEDINDETECDNDSTLLCKILDSTHSRIHEQDHGKIKCELTRPKSPPRVSIDDPEFDRLTSAEKLNDCKYRGLIYETYHDEPTCSCLPTNRSTHPMICRSGCLRSCCMALRNPDALSKKFSALATFAPDDFHLKSDTKQNKIHNDSARMRGGVDTDDNYLNEEMLQNKKFCTWQDDIINQMISGNDNTSTYVIPKPTTDVIYENNSLCRPRAVDEIKATKCICSEKISTPCRTNASKCTKKSCVGADCMIRAFKEAQEFVDSLGKEPGLVGLGLMDPSESPYFGRIVERDYAAQEGEQKYRVSVPPTSIQCPAPCNKQINKITISTPYIESTSVTTAIPGRPGVARETKPTLLGTQPAPISVKSKKKENKKEEKIDKHEELDVIIPAPPDIEIGPCGEPKCKSRRRKLKDNRPVPVDIAEKAQEDSMHPTSLGTIAPKTVKKIIARERYPKVKADTGGDRYRGPIKVSRRIMRYVYSIGDVYPGTNYGHKNCIDPRLRVPANMGWLWNTSSTEGKLKPRIGWKPGAIGRYLNQLLKKAKGASKMEDFRARSIPSRTSPRRGKVFKSLSYVQAKREAEEDVKPPPTLHVLRKDGTTYVTMHPIRQEAADASRVEEPTKPLQFKITRNKDDSSVASSSTASDIEIEFSPPAAFNRQRRKPNVIHVDTQVRQQEILDAYR